jgi:pyruvate carboxylase
MEELIEFYKVIIDDTPYEAKITPKFLRRKKYIPADPKKITAVIPGVIQEVNVRKGQSVNSGDNLFILEAMKMKNSVKASQDGIIKEVYVNAGSVVAKNELIIEFQ